MRTFRCLAGLLISAVAASALAAPPKPNSILETTEQKAVETIALSLLDEPAIRKVRADVIQRYLAAPPGQLEDGRKTVEGAVDELLWGVLLAAASDPANPSIVWTETLPRTVGKRKLPGSRYAGDSSDRIYRGVTIDPNYRYEIRGRFGKHAPLYFSIEAIPRPAFWGLPPVAVIMSKDVDIAADGSFTITVDNTPTAGRRNHLQTPANAAMLLLRDTIPDWNRQAPTALSIHRIDDAKAKPRTRSEMIAQAVVLMDECVPASLKFFEGIWRRPANGFETYVRDLGWGMLVVQRFSLKDDEATLVTLDPVSAKYLSLQLMDPWLRTATYSNRTTTLNDHQAQANADGTITFVLSPRDPGIHNWVDTGGLNDGIVAVRWELLTEKADKDKAVVAVKTLPLAELAAVLPAGVKRVTAAERKQQLAERLKSYEVRLRY